MTKSGVGPFGSSRRGSAPALDENIENEAVLVDGTPEPMLLPGKLTTTSSRCHLSLRRGARRRIRLANSRPNLRPHLSLTQQKRKLQGYRYYPRYVFKIAAYNSDQGHGPWGEPNGDPLDDLDNRHPDALSDELADGRTIDVFAGQNALGCTKSQEARRGLGDYPLV